MLRVHLTDGRTLRFDLSDERQASKWLEQIKDTTFQACVTGLTLQCNGTQLSLTRPGGYERVWMFAEHLPAVQEQRFKGGERIICQADETRTTVMVHAEQRAARVSLFKPGTQCYNPMTIPYFSKPRN